MDANERTLKRVRRGLDMVIGQTSPKVGLKLRTRKHLYTFLQSAILLGKIRH